MHAPTEVQYIHTTHPGSLSPPHVPLELPRELCRAPVWPSLTARGWDEPTAQELAERLPGAFPTQGRVTPSFCPLPAPEQAAQ